MLTMHLRSRTCTDKVDGARDRTDHSVTRVLAIDCEMVGVGPGKISVLARVSIVNMWGNVVYDKYVRPAEEVTDFRTRWSGIRPCNLTKSEVWSTGKDDPLSAEDFSEAQKEVSEILKNRLLVGHALHNDRKALLLTHPQKDIRDTQNYGPLQSGNGRSALKYLAQLHLGILIQQGEHDSVEDARTALSLYLLFQDGWENMAHQIEYRKANKSSVGTHTKPLDQTSVGGNNRLRKANESNIGNNQPSEGTRGGRNKRQRPCYSKKTSRVG